MRYPAYVESSFNFPDFYRARFNPPSMALADPVTYLEQILSPAMARAGIRKGQTVAVGVGSRGIDRIASLVPAICRCITAVGAVPWIIPAMGSHGSATPEGQRQVLEKLGVTQEACGAPIMTDMETERVATVFGSVPVFFSAKALEADHALCINRIKPHTKFKGDVESGLYKMMVVGMGKHQGALAYHNHALAHGFYRLLTEMGDAVLANANLCLGIGVVEDAHDQIMDIEVIPAAGIRQAEPRLLEKAKACFPSLPYDTLDVLAVRQIGKEISGSGMDPNVTGRTCDLMEDDFSASLDVKRLVVLDLSPHTYGNAIGLGNADMITEKVFQGMDYEAMVMNALTSMSLKKAGIPVRLPSEEKVIQAAFQTIGPVAPGDVRAVIIKDTMHTIDFLISRALVEETRKLPHLIDMTPTSLRFNRSGDLI